MDLAPGTLVEFVAGGGEVLQGTIEGSVKFRTMRELKLIIRCHDVNHSGLFYRYAHEIKVLS